MSKNILLIAYKFYPAGGVGSRRWIKFCKYLVKQGFHVHIISGNFTPEYNSNAWETDVKSLKSITIYNVGSNLLPDYIFSNKRSKSHKLMSIPLRAYLRLCTSDIDYAQGWGKEFVPKAVEIINKFGIKTMIATGAPFSVLAQASMIKIQKSEIKFIADLRDPWIEDYNNRRFPEKLSSIEKFSKNYILENQVLNCADEVLTISKTLISMMSKNHNIPLDKFHYLPNGFDPADYVQDTDTREDEVIKVVYPGALTGGRMEAIELLQESLTEYSKEKLQNIEFHFIGSKFEVKEIKLKSRFVFHDYMKSSDLNKFVKSCDYGLVINSKNFSYLYSSKAAEFIGQGKNILLVSEDGELSNILEGTNSIHMNYTRNSFIKALDCLNKSGSSNSKKICDSFNIEKLTDRLIRVIE